MLICVRFSLNDGQSQVPSFDLNNDVLVDMLEQNSNRIRAVNRRKWSKDDNGIAMECFMKEQAREQRVQNENG